MDFESEVYQYPPSYPAYVVNINHNSELHELARLFYYQITTPEQNNIIRAVAKNFSEKH